MKTINIITFDKFKNKPNRLINDEERSNINGVSDAQNKEKEKHKGQQHLFD
jgi:hypothetical protein